jgi:N6-adenosine-specific RNA methylase IME4
MRVSGDQTTIIVADPPWPHANGSRTNSGKSPKYPLMNLREIAALGPAVERLAGDDAVLYIWATTPHLPGAIDTIRAWGFRYRSLHVWRKTKIACGFWARSNAELVLVGERGRPCAPNESLLAATIMDAPPEVSRLHSAKPSTVHEMVERLWPGARKRELFARRERDGWQGYGSDLGHRIEPTSFQIEAVQ